jgi:hypothetical protein
MPSSRSATVPAWAADPGGAAIRNAEAVATPSSCRPRSRTNLPTGDPRTYAPCAQVDPTVPVRLATAHPIHARSGRAYPTAPVLVPHAPPLRCAGVEATAPAGGHCPRVSRQARPSDRFWVRLPRSRLYLCPYPRCFNRAIRPRLRRLLSSRAPSQPILRPRPAASRAHPSWRVPDARCR